MVEQHVFAIRSLHACMLRAAANAVYLSFQIKIISRPITYRIGVSFLMYVSKSVGTWTQSNPALQGNFLIGHEPLKPRIYYKKIRIFKPSRFGPLLQDCSALSFQPQNFWQIWLICLHSLGLMSGEWESELSNSTSVDNAEKQEITKKSIAGQ